MRKFGYLAGAALAVSLAAAPLAAQEEAPLPISSIEIDADIAAIGSRAAADFWRDLPRDLESAIARELFDRIGQDGATVRVSVDELALAEAFESEFMGPNARLAGQVQIFDAEGEPLTGVWDVAASTSQAEALLPPDVDIAVISRTSAEFYLAVVDAFARGVAQAVEGEAAAMPEEG